MQIEPSRNLIFVCDTSYSRAWLHLGLDEVFDFFEITLLYGDHYRVSVISTD